MTRTLSPDLARETAKEPPKRWVNWYRAKRPGLANDQVVLPGDLIRGRGVLPSREIAEQKSWESKPPRGSLEFELRYEYLGAFPEGERP